MKAERLAHALKSMTDGLNASDRARVFESFMTYLRARGYTPLLPRILSEYERLVAHSGKKPVRVTMAKKHPYKELLTKHDIHDDAELTLDETLIGGYRIETDTTLIDASHKNALLKIYHSITK
jgi:F0F1-type ATP synthase delta subunit